MKDNCSSRKTALSILVLICFISKTANTQESYIGIGAALGFGINGIDHPLFEQSSITGNQNTVKTKKLHLGKSHNFRAEYNHYFNEFIGIGFHGAVIRGDWQNFSSERKIVYTQHKSQSVRCNGFSLSAAIHARAGDYQVTPYFSVKPGFFAGSIDLYDTISYSGQVTTSAWEYSGLNSFFVAFAGGLDISITKNTTLYFELEHRTLTVAPKTGNLKLLNGSDQLDDIFIREKRIIFVDKHTFDYTQVPDENTPSKAIRPFFPLNNFQIRIGLKFLLTQ